MGTKLITLAGVGMLSLGAFSSVLGACCSQVTAPMTQEAILNRLKPLGTVETEAGVIATKPIAPQALSANAGEERYKSTCSVCHDAGLAGAPKFRSAGDWKSRMEVGLDGMLKIAIQGKGGMPPKGTCLQCSDEELKAAIKYMLPR